MKRFRVEIPHAEPAFGAVELSGADRSEGGETERVGSAEAERSRDRGQTNGVLPSAAHEGDGHRSIDHVVPRGEGQGGQARDDVETDR